MNDRQKKTLGFVILIATVLGSLVVGSLAVYYMAEGTRVAQTTEKEELVEKEVRLGDLIVSEALERNDLLRLFYSNYFFHGFQGDTLVIGHYTNYVLVDGGGSADIYVNLTQVEKTEDGHPFIWLGGKKITIVDYTAQTLWLVYEEGE